MPVTDDDAALQAIAALENLSTEQTKALDSINQILANDEPFVDINELFSHYNVLYFRSLLLPGVELIWSKRLTLCAGICELSKDPATGKFTRIRLKMSTPLLQYRPRSDTINTLLHEAIHAYFFITTSWQHIRGDDGTGHGVGFQTLASAINNHGNYDVTIYHTFHDEVESYRTHVWQCDGPCRTRSPYFGFVKRSMNRPPGKSDTWWIKHETECGGTYTKIQEPPPTKKQIEAMSKKERAGRQKNKLDGWFKLEKSTDSRGITPNDTIGLSKGDGTSMNKFSSKRKLGYSIDILDGGSATGQKRPRATVLLNEKTLVDCPICSICIAEAEINEHLDLVHPP
jgi:hypothetical protein